MSIYTIAPATWTNDLPVPNSNTFNKEIHDRLVDVDNADTAESAARGAGDSAEIAARNAAIAAILPTWVTWNATGSGAILSGYELAKYAIVGKILHYHFYAYNRSLSGTANPITINLPFASVLQAIYQSTLVYNGTAWDHAQVVIGLNSGTISIFKTLAGGNWVANETGLIISVNGFYGIA